MSLLSSKQAKNHKAPLREIKHLDKFTARKVQMTQNLSNWFDFSHCFPNSLRRDGSSASANIKKAIPERGKTERLFDSFISSFSWRNSLRQMPSSAIARFALFWKPRQARWVIGRRAGDRWHRIGMRTTRRCTTGSITSRLFVRAHAAPTIHFLIQPGDSCCRGTASHGIICSVCSAVVSGGVSCLVS
jgi:hypothetical protein